MMLREKAVIVAVGELCMKDSCITAVTLRGCVPVEMTGN